MLLISPTILRDFGFHINYAYFFRVVPFQWDYKAGKLCLRDSEKNWTLRNWKVVSILIFLYEAFILFRFYESMSGQMETLVQHTFEMVFILGFTLMCVVQVMFIFKRDAIVKLVSDYMDYFQELQGISKRFKVQTIGVYIQNESGICKIMLTLK